MAVSFVQQLLVLPYAISLLTLHTVLSVVFCIASLYAAKRWIISGLYGRELDLSVVVSAVTGPYN